ncbi:NAD(P)/FAD-dependent oxidoreductase [Methanobacterium petrolearium]|uniref:NAD(P)/FAD-dependent oxidoreductase n=1 Tax=Methanobacterium petrolearium TaxID=710190 RepID=UPI001AE83D6E|nr:NAD(P)/FAD-dependent oxidoreductase [Methanobacterium petrolearium]MBP1945951.1 digeranylgeranylglycerophospholipid reductase [Methanobacterium petrolearium]BDZ69490.1 digeranylgeranylglycerophospholipid reductase [Methanobacterium petrolearium]BDZ72232.1 digeranylgeranylglycerophospholipid reductase [Methanobacterium petrolearium]
MKYDIVVVGGRIGGSTASIFASKNGADVLMLEKNQEIGTPVQCAEATSSRTFKTLEMKPSSKYVCSEIKGADIYAPDGTHGHLEGGYAEGFILERKLFDKHLAIEAAKSGADIMVKTIVKDVLRKEGKVCGVVAKHMGRTMEIEADIVIAADGIESRVAQMAGLNTSQTTNSLCSCAQYEMVGLNTDPNYLKFHFGEKIAPKGYAWIFPKGDNVANVGVGVRSNTETAYHFLKKFTTNMDATPVELNIGGVPVLGPVKKTYTDGLLVVGDAAGQVEPFTGGGIHIAAHCGRVAGEIAAEGIEKEKNTSNFLKKYEKRWKNEIGKDIKDSLKYRKILDKLTDEEINILAKFLKEQDLESISKMSMLGLVKEYPQFLKLLKDLL